MCNVSHVMFTVDVLNTLGSLHMTTSSSIGVQTQHYKLQKHGCHCTQNYYALSLSETDIHFAHIFIYVCFIFTERPDVRPHTYCVCVVSQLFLAHLPVCVLWHYHYGHTSPTLPKTVYPTSHLDINNYAIFRNECGGGRIPIFIVQELQIHYWYSVI